MNTTTHTIFSGLERLDIEKQRTRGLAIASEVPETQGVRHNHCLNGWLVDGHCLSLTVPTLPTPLLFRRNGCQSPLPQGIGNNASTPHFSISQGVLLQCGDLTGQRYTPNLPSLEKIAATTKEETQEEVTTLGENVRCSTTTDFNRR